MISVAGYSDLQMVHQSAETLVYSAQRSHDGVKVVLKLLRPEIASPDQAACYQKEYKFLSSLDSELIIKAYDLVEQSNSPILVLENASWTVR